MPTDTFYPSAGAVSPCDGQVGRLHAFDTWSQLRDGAGTMAHSTSSIEDIVLYATSSNWYILRRSIFMFDTSSIGTGQTITSATLSLRGYAKSNSLNLTDAQASLALVGVEPASTDDLVPADYGEFDATRLATDIAYSAFSTTGYNVFTLNAAGIANINKTGISKFGVRFACDADNAEPTWVANQTAKVTFYAADEAGTDKDPKLVVTYIPEGLAATITPTVLTITLSIPSSQAFEAEDVLEDAFFVDSGLSYRGVSTTTISGLDHLEGKTVSILADGVVQTPKVVTSGSITLDTAATHVIAGLPYASILQTMAVEYGDNKGTIQGRKKRTNQVVIRLHQAKQFKFGATPEGTLFEKTFSSLFSGDYEADFPMGWDREGTITLKNDKPLPFCVVAIVPEVTVS